MLIKNDKIKRFNNDTIISLTVFVTVFNKVEKNKHLLVQLQDQKAWKYKDLKQIVSYPSH